MKKTKNQGCIKLWKQCAGRSLRFRKVLLVLRFKLECLKLLALHRLPESSSLKRLTLSPLLFEPKFSEAEEKFILTKILIVTFDYEKSSYHYHSYWNVS